MKENGLWSVQLPERLLKREARTKVYLVDIRFAGIQIDKRKSSNEREPVDSQTEFCESIWAVLVVPEEGNEQLVNTADTSFVQLLSQISYVTARIVKEKADLFQDTDFVSQTSDTITYRHRDRTLCSLDSHYLVDKEDDEQKDANLLNAELILKPLRGTGFGKGVAFNKLEDLKYLSLSDWKGCCWDQGYVGKVNRFQLNLYNCNQMDVLTLSLIGPKALHVPVKCFLLNDASSLQGDSVVSVISYMVKYSTPVVGTHLLYLKLNEKLSVHNTYCIQVLQPILYNQFRIRESPRKANLFSRLVNSKEALVPSTKFLSNQRKIKSSESGAVQSVKFAINTNPESFSQINAESHVANFINDLIKIPVGKQLTVDILRNCDANEAWPKGADGKSEILVTLWRILSSHDPVSEGFIRVGRREMRMQFVKTIPVFNDQENFRRYFLKSRIYSPGSYLLEISFYDELVRGFVPMADGPVNLTVFDDNVAQTESFMELRGPGVEPGLLNEEREELIVDLRNFNRVTQELEFVFFGPKTTFYLQVSRLNHVSELVKVVYSINEACTLNIMVCSHLS
ncbi:hypothetical protein Ciccas_008538 [Cichlidogyrus casuarinus]|uniref:Uncharacterized protein n=1 Tax=Cichlidogyrus casuarinus TaxID=1844966 RepID=A0ABD2Q2A8_9PLAT